MACQAECQKQAKYAELTDTHHFVPVAIETLGVFGLEACSFLSELGWHVQEEIGEALSGHHLLQQIAVAVQKGIAVAVLGASSVGRDLFDPF